MKKAFSVILTLAMTLSLGLPALAQTDTSNAAYAHYLSLNEDQKTYYNDVYRPVYAEYRQAVSVLRAKIREVKLESREQAEQILAVLQNMTARHRAFFGDRTTVGLSRYEVPAAREAMYRAADTDHNYAAAADYCVELKRLVTLRVAFMQKAIGEMEAFAPAAAANGIAWLEKQLMTSGTVATGYFASRPGNTSLDSTGYNFAPSINASMKATIGLDAGADCSWRIYKCLDGSFNIIWSYVCINSLGAGASLDAVAFYNTSEKVVHNGSAIVRTQNVNVSGAQYADIPVIKDFVKA